MKIVCTLITLMVMVPLLVVAKDKDDSSVYRISVLPGQTLEQTVSSEKQFKSFELELHSEIESWVSVTKEVETKSSKHKGKSLVIALTVPEDASPGVYLSQVYFDKKPSKKSKSLTVELEVLEPVISLPPEPGNENDTTVEGIDSDADGVRDDVQRYIYFEYAGQPSVQLALMDVARSLQSALIGAESREQAYQAVKAFDSAYNCLSWVVPGTSYEVASRCMRSR
ncbi:hypothetical protein JCM19231_1408 [Vibrio ishigakensis]|uniref:BatD protein n=1 Tax=Vibrio ishigakensis TaxID=1481914 RepID=A0A0B8P029_9VIBR|nr:hypothetical protein JCM19231_1408 [Vibrio ishigakensis]